MDFLFVEAEEGLAIVDVEQEFLEVVHVFETVFGDELSCFLVEYLVAVAYFVFFCIFR